MVAIVARMCSPLLPHLSSLAGPNSRGNLEGEGIRCEHGFWTCDQ